MFTTSLARIQFDAWSIARAEGRNEPGYIEITPDEGRGRLCEIYKFNSIGFRNITLAGFAWLMAVPWITLFFSLEVATAKKIFLACCCNRRKVGDSEGELGVSQGEVEDPQGEVGDSQSEPGDPQGEVRDSQSEPRDPQDKEDDATPFLVVNLLLRYLFKFFTCAFNKLFEGAVQLYVRYVEVSRND